MIRSWPSLLLLAAFILTAWLAHGWVQQEGSLPLRTVTIDGELAHLDGETLRLAAAEVVRGGFFSVDLRKVRDDLEALAWVDSASVRRVWPDALDVQIVEQVPVARWGDHELLNQRGERFLPELSQIPEGLPFLRGPEGSERQVFERYFEFSSLLASHEIKIVRLELDRRRAWSLITDEQIRIEFGRDDTGLRMARFNKIWPLLAARSQRPGRIDLRYPNGVAVGFSNG